MEETKGTPQTRAKNKYNAKAYDRIALQVKKGRKDIIKAHAENNGESINGFVNRAIDETMERDNTNEADISEIQTARKEYANGETVSHNAINWE